MCYTAIPGKTGCLAIRDVPPARAPACRPKTSVKRRPVNEASRCWSYTSNLHKGGHLVKKLLSFDEESAKSDRKVFNTKAKNGTKRRRPSHKSIRKGARLI